MEQIGKLGDHVIKNGELIAAEDAVVPVGLREVQYSFYVYESLRILHGEIVHLDDHLKRMEGSCAGIHLEHPFTSEQIEAWVHDLIEADGIGDASMKIQVYGGPEPMCFIFAFPIIAYPDSYYEDGVKITTYEGERFLPTCKTGNLLLNYLALEDSKRQGGFEAVLADREGRVLEGTRSNFYGFRDGKLYTAGDGYVMPGVTRTRVITAAQQMGIEVVFDAPLVEDLHAGLYDEVFISATSMAAMPVCQLDDVKFENGFERTLAICKQVREWELQEDK